MKNTSTQEEDEVEHLPATQTGSDENEREAREGDIYAVNGAKGGGNPNEFVPSPATEIATRVRTREHRASQAREERPISAFPWSLAEEGGLHGQSQAQGDDQGTKHRYPASRELGCGGCREPNRPKRSE
jgi:hypothetical protein